MLLAPGEQSVYDRSSGAMRQREVDTRDFIAWKEGDLYFDNNTLAEITGYLSRNYDYQFGFDDPTLKELRFTLDMPRPATLQAVLDRLSKSRNDFTFRVKGRTVEVIRHNHQ